jgi:hypothetical protein
MDEDEPPEVLNHRVEKAGFLESFPTTEEEADAVEGLLASELSGLSLSERDKGMFDVHGISNVIEETPELIERSLDDLEKEIRKIKKKVAYENAKKMNSSFESDPEFQIMFLRSELFNCKNAAKILSLHFEKKAEIFGSGEIVGRDVCSSDMGPENLKILRSGSMQVLPSRNVAGRSVLCFIPGNRILVEYPRIVSRKVW